MSDDDNATRRAVERAVVAALVAAVVRELRADASTPAHEKDRPAQSPTAPGANDERGAEGRDDEYSHADTT